MIKKPHLSMEIVSIIIHNKKEQECRTELEKEHHFEQVNKQLITVC